MAKARNRKKTPPPVVREGVNPFTAQHGQYEPHGLAQINRGGATIDRWKAAKVFDDGERLAIDHCQTLWAKLDGHAFSDAPSNSTGDGGWAQLAAMDELGRFKHHVGARHWDVFENICRENFASRDALARSGFACAESTASASAQMLVKMIASQIAGLKGY